MARRVKKTTKRPARVVADRIEGPNRGGSVKKVGPRTPVEAEGLSGRAGARPGSVRQVGPSSIRPSGGSGATTRRVGGENFEDRFAVDGLSTPYARQSGSVKQVGPADGVFSRDQQGTGSAGTPKTGRVSAAGKVIHKTPLLKSGAGRAYDFGKHVGQPGTKPGSAVKAGAAGGSILVSGRRRKTPPAQPQGSEIVEPSGATIVPGHTGSDFINASGSLGDAGDENLLVFTSILKDRTLGNEITVEFIDPAANSQALDVTVDDYAIEVSLATDAGGVITSTAAQVRTAVNADGEANDLVSVAHGAGSDGTGLVEEGDVELSGGFN